MNKIDKMKTIIFILLLSLMSTALVAQKKIYYTKNLDAYVGTWVYESNDTIFKIKFKKGSEEGLDAIFNGLYGGYLLSVKGSVIEDYMSRLPVSWNYRTEPKPRNLYIWATNSSYHIEDVTPNFLGVMFYDQRKKHFGGKGLGGGLIQLLSPDKIHWKLDEKRGIWNETEGDDSIDEAMLKPIGFSVPSDVIMVKEK